MTIRTLGRAARIAVATLTGALIAGGAGFAIIDHQSVPGVLAGTSTTPPKVILASPLATSTAPATSPTALAASPIEPAATAVVDDLPFVSARVAPRVDSVDPISARIPVNSPIVITFSQPMDRTSVEMSFVMTPQVEGRFTWRDDFTVQFDPFRLAYATPYQVVVRGRSIRGVPLAEAKMWSFSTGSGSPDVLAPGARAINVPILTYHYIRVNVDSRDRMGFALSVTPADFAAQMDWLARSGYHTITSEDLYQYLSGARGLPSKPVILTFDDGYADFYTTALPILRSHEFTADLYVVAGFVGRPGYVTAAQVREADRSGIEIGAHSVTHADLTRISVARVRSELVDSKRFLEQLIGHPVVSFCYPSGKVNWAVSSEVAAAGFHGAMTTRFGYSHSLADRYVWTRLRVGGGERLDELAAAVVSAS